MTRTPFLAAALIAALSAGPPVLAQPTALRAEFAAPFGSPSQIIIDGRMWSCAGSACTSAANDPRPEIACRKLARKVGLVGRFTTPQGELDADGLAACNRDRK